MHAGCCFIAEIEGSPDGNGPDGVRAQMQTAPKGRVAEMDVSLPSGSQPLRRGVVMVLHSVLVATHLTIEFVHQLIDRRIQIFM